MSFNTKIILFSIVLIGAAGFGSFRYYQKTHPKYVPLPPREEVTITIIPGWNLRDVAEYLVKKGFASTTDEVYMETGMPAKDFRLIAAYQFDPHEARPFLEIPPYASKEGFLAPETYRVYKDATVRDIVDKLLEQRKKEFTEEMKLAGEKSGRPGYDIMIMARIIEKEVKHDEDRAKVSDILWGRLKTGWALQVDSSVHYFVDRTGDVFTTEKERETDSPWNTYLHPGLPLGPICNPSVESIRAAIYPEKNNYWYFLSGRDGKMYYGKTLEDHAVNKKYL